MYSLAVQILRIFFAVGVALYHTWHGFEGGYIGVDFFFILNGFLMAYTDKENITDSIGKQTIGFIRKKFVGIIPYYFVAWLITLAWNCLIGQENLLKQLAYSPYSLLQLEMIGLADIGGARVISGWYLSAMLLAMWVIYPLRKRLADTFDYVIAPLLFFWFVSFSYHNGGIVATTGKYLEQFNIYNGVIRAVGEISIGTFTYAVYHSMHANLTKCSEKLCRIIWCAIVVIAAVFIVNWKQRFESIIVLLFIPLIILCFLHLQSRSEASAPAKAVDYIGKLTFQIYLTQGLVMGRVMPSLMEVYGLTFDVRYYAIAFALITALSLLVKCAGDRIAVRLRH